MRREKNKVIIQVVIADLLKARVGNPGNARTNVTNAPPPLPSSPLIKAKPPKHRNMHWQATVWSRWHTHYLQAIVSSLVISVRLKASIIRRWLLIHRHASQSFHLVEFITERRRQTPTVFLIFFPDYCYYSWLIVFLKQLHNPTFNLQLNPYQDCWQLQHHEDDLISLESQCVLHISWSGCTEPASRWLYCDKPCRENGNKKFLFYLRQFYLVCNAWRFTDLNSKYDLYMNTI